MRSFNLTTDMDFRVIPSAIPLQSPSPDKKTINIITPTISPNTIQIKKGTTPIRNVRLQKQNTKSPYQPQTQAKYHSQSVGNDLSNALKEKDDIIKNLRNVIDMITETNRYKKSTQLEQTDLKGQVKVLTIQNQKLVNIIDKMSKNKYFDDSITKANEQYESRITQLMRTAKQNQTFYEQQIKQLKRFNKSLNAHCKNLQNQNKQLQMQNKKLLAILKQKSQSQKRNNEKNKSYDSNDQPSEQKSINLSQNKSQQKLSLIKIREQHSQNLKILKEALIKQIEQTFDTMKIAIEGINSKINSLSTRLMSAQKTLWSGIRKNHIQTQSITISIRESSRSFRNQDAPITDRSYRPSKKHNQQIYIEEGPSSSHQRASRDQFSRLEQVFSSSQKNLSNPLQTQLKAVKAQLNQLRFKYQKICLDTSQLGFSQRVKSQQLSGMSQRYDQMKKQFSNKQKQVSILYQQIRRIQQENLRQHKKKDDNLRQKQKQVQKIKQIHQEQIQQLKNQTELKVKLLVQNYQRQIQMLQRELMIKNANLNQASESSFIEKSQFTKRLQNTNKRSAQLQLENKDIKDKIRLLESSYENVKQNLSKIQNELNQKLQQAQQQLRLAQQKLKQTQRKLKQSQQSNQNLIKKYEQQKQRQSQSDSNHVQQISVLKSELQSKQDEISLLNEKQTKNEHILKQNTQQIQKLRKLLLKKQNMIVRLQQCITQWNSSVILQQIQQIKKLLQNDNQNYTITEQTKTSKQTFQTSLPYKQSQQISALRKQNHQLRTQLIEKDEKNSQLQSKVQQLQNLYEKTKMKLIQQQQLYIQLMDRVTQYEQQILKVQSEKEQFIKQYRQKSNSSIILKRIQEIYAIEQQRKQYIRNILSYHQNQDQKQQ